MNPFATSFFSNLARVRNARSARWSSFDRSGRNADWWAIPPGRTLTIAEIDGPGAITHVWFTQWCQRLVAEDLRRGDPDMYRTTVLKIYWDGEKNPSIHVPVGDFFCLGHSIASNFCSLPFSSSTNTPGQFGGGAALNCYLPMPFHRHARVELTNEGEHTYCQYFYIDYEQYDEPLDDDVACLHAQWRRENPTDGWAHDMQVNHKRVDVPNLDGRGNYVLLDARGRGHYVGCNLSVTNLHGDWWGEGDDMIWVDGWKWPPDLHGTGSEDYFNQAWCTQRNAFLFNGSALWENDRPPYQVSYNFHLTNPVHFRKSILVTMEHGHANQLANDWASTAYWYQLEPHRPFGLPPVEQRLPIRLDAGAEWVTPKRIPKTRLTREQAGTKRKAAQAIARQRREKSAEFLARYRAQQAAFRKERKLGAGGPKRKRRPWPRCASGGDSGQT